MKPHPCRSGKIERSWHFYFPVNRDDNPFTDFITKLNGETYRAAELLGFDYHAAIVILALLIGNGPNSELQKLGSPLNETLLRKHAANTLRLDP